MRLHKISFIAITALAALLVGSCATEKCSVKSDKASVEPFFELQQIYEGPRFVNIVTAVDGTLLAFHGQKSIAQVRRSGDGGKTWQPAINIGHIEGQLGSAVVDENSGDVILFHAGNIWRSGDNGKTWSHQSSEADAIKPNTAVKIGEQWSIPGAGNSHGSESGITLRYGKHKGRLLAPARVNPRGNDPKVWFEHYNTAIYSDDGGYSWQTSDPFPEYYTGEGTLAELSDGRIFYNSRSHNPETTMRRTAWSYDGGQSWQDWQESRELHDAGGAVRERGGVKNYGCNAGMIRLPIDGRDILLYSQPTTPDRTNMTVFVSFDGGKSWPVKRLIFEGPSAYSSLAAGRKGTPSEGLIYLQFEGGRDGMYSACQVARFNLEWLTDPKGQNDSGSFTN